MIITSTPYCPASEGAAPEPGRDYGYAINCVMERLREHDWLFLYEHDLFLTTRTWYRRLERAVLQKPNAGFFTVMRYPAVTAWSAPQEAKPGQYDIRYHRKLGAQIEKAYEGRVDDVTEYEKLPSGLATAGIFLVKKAVWAEVGGFKAGFKEEKIDYDFHNRVRATGRKCYLIRDVYMFHAKGL